ncbi:GAF and ANTAR domain-containing protein [Streptomyces cylindrosporus]|uniref:GAF and ANTAR domain-containing protein n=1 Tax=Streptomyces cylindrosporus TaxID=2927583 RepID=A0ABS9Y2X9_9ACTN|nr:GAF and ANTAR domain-containing protein [Streptomyces cylindrosporus]MCI3271545.1 GAF and ANTAR domain-containing protein [Streptomyces cylindrosporus]
MPTTEREAGIAEAVSDLARHAVDFDAPQLLQDLTTHTLALLPPQCAGVTLLDDDGRVAYTIASDELSRQLESHQAELGEGPGPDSVGREEPLGPVALRATGPDSLRWPRFGPRARALGVISVAAVPLRVSDHALGALDLFSTRPPLPSALDLSVARSLATVAASSLLLERRLKGQQVVVGQLRQALESRVVIEQAKGILAERLQISVDEAFRRLRAHARSQGRRLTVLAAEIAEGAGPGELDPSP